MSIELAPGITITPGIVIGEAEPVIVPENDNQTAEESNDTE